MDAQRGIARRMVIGLPPAGLSPAWERDFSAYPPAGVILFRRDFRDLEGLRKTTAHLRELARPRRLLLAIDEEGGWVSQLAGHLTVPPNAALLARGGAPGDVEWACRVSGERLRALGIDWNFAPVADVNSEPLNPVIGPRSFGRDPATVTELASEAVRGYRAAGLASCLKHFPGHGDTAIDSHLALPNCALDRATLERIHIAPFRDMREADAVMTAHVVYPALDPGQPATFSRAIVHDLLRGQLGFEGVCITDALEMKGASAGRSPFEMALGALEAGCDLLLFAFHDEAVRRVRLELAKALVDGAIDRESFDAARPRLAKLDRERPEPTAAELARPLESLTPSDWEPRLERIIERGLRVEGRLPASAAALPWRVTEPEFPHGGTLTETLRGLGVPLAEGTDEAVELIAIATRVPPAEAEIERLRAIARTRPLLLAGLQNDAFLDQIPEAAVRLSAADSTPLTRKVVARVLADQVLARTS